jgi:hypothetical protein
LSPAERWRAKNPGYQRTWRARNAEKVREYQRAYSQKATTKEVRRAWEAANRDKRLGYHLKRYFNISVADYRSMLHRQRGLCGICKRPSKRRLDVDHCHQSGRVRGLLCNPCNRLLGFVERYFANPKAIDRWLLR